MSNSNDTILVIEDEESLGEGLCFNLQIEGFETVWLKDGQLALEEIRSNYTKYSAILLDVMLPRVDGFQILKETRNFAQQIPICVLSAKSQDLDKITALELGADDYVTKPFALAELMLRVKGLVKRHRWYKTESVDKAIVFGSASVNLSLLTVQSKSGKTVRISPTEGLLIQELIKHENILLSRTQLLESVWHYDAKIETRTVDVFISKLRKIVEENPAKPVYLLSVRGVGYAYVTDAQLRENLSVEKA